MNLISKSSSVQISDDVIKSVRVFVACSKV